MWYHASESKLMRQPPEHGETKGELSIVLTAATHMRCSLWTACHAAHPMWQQWRGSTVLRP